MSQAEAASAIFADELESSDYQYGSWLSEDYTDTKLPGGFSFKAKPGRKTNNAKEKGPWTSYSESPCNPEFQCPPWVAYDILRQLERDFKEKQITQGPPREQDVIDHKSPTDASKLLVHACKKEEKSLMKPIKDFPNILDSFVE
ncbi:hypothetical protein FRC10_012051, partial [Ceratobasidium sp. 414]